MDLRSDHPGFRIVSLRHLSALEQFLEWDVAENAAWAKVEQARKVGNFVFMTDVGE